MTEQEWREVLDAINLVKQSYLRFMVARPNYKAVYLSQMEQVVGRVQNALRDLLEEAKKDK